MDSVNGILAGFRNDDALTQRQAVRLDYHRNPAIPDIFQCLIHIVECLVFRRRNSVFFHQILGERLAALDNCSRLRRSEARNALLIQHVHQSQNQRIVRCHHHIIHVFLHAPLRNLVQVLGTDCHAFRILRNSAVSRQRVDFRNLRALLQ